MSLYKFFRPLLFTLPPEMAHGVTIAAMKVGVFPSAESVSNPALEQTLWGLKFPNPVGLSAGFDKNAEVIGPAFRLGFGFVEAGTVTPKPQTGNPKPRIFRDPSSEAVINRMGFPNAGMHTFKDNLEQFLSRKARPSGVLRINIGMNKNQKDPAKDYARLIQMLAPMADYLAVNISSPNTPGLRDLQARGPLLEILEAIKTARAKACRTNPPPILVKFAPDLEDTKMEELAETVVEGTVDGIILTNTTLARPEYLPADFAAEKGGLSGQPLKDKSTAVIQQFYRLTNKQIPIIGVGGIASAEDAYAKIRAGASLVQLYTGLVYEGPQVAARINHGLTQFLQRDGFKNLAEAVGIDA